MAMIAPTRMSAPAGTPPLRNRRRKGEFGLLVDLVPLTTEATDRLVGIEAQGRRISPHEADSISRGGQSGEIALLDRSEESRFKTKCLGNGIDIPSQPLTRGPEFPADTRRPFARLIGRFAREA